jgi:hypothetical protein
MDATIRGLFTVSPGEDASGGGFLRDSELPAIRSSGAAVALA